MPESHRFNRWEWLKAATIQRVEEGLEAARDRTIRDTIQGTLQNDLADLAIAIEQDVSSGSELQTLRQIDRAVQAILTRGDGLILFPEGRLGTKEGTLHLPLKRGTAIYAIRTGVPIVPVALIGTQDLYLGKTLTLRFGEPLRFPQVNRPKRQEVDAVLEALQNSLMALLPVDYQEPTGAKPLRYFLNHMLY